MTADGTRIELRHYWGSDARVTDVHVSGFDLSPISAVTMSKVKKVVEEARETGNPELDLVDMKIESLEHIPNLRK